MILFLKAAYIAHENIFSESKLMFFRMFYVMLSKYINKQLRISEQSFFV